MNGIFGGLACGALEHGIGEHMKANDLVQLYEIYGRLLEHVVFAVKLSNTAMVCLFAIFKVLRLGWSEMLGQCLFGGNSCMNEQAH